MAVTFESEIEKLLAREGGYVNHPADRGGETKYGISANANPDIDIKALTREGAKKLYKDRYWDKANISNLPENMRGPGFDAVVNHGVGGGLPMIAQAYGDPTALANIRQQKYQDIVSNDPTQAVFAKGWQNRMAEFDNTTNPTVQREAARIAQNRENSPRTEYNAGMPDIRQINQGMRQAYTDAPQRSWNDFGNIMLGIQTRNKQLSSFASPEMEEHTLGGNNAEHYRSLLSYINNR